MNEDERASFRNDLVARNRRIVELAKQGITPKQIAARYGLNASYVSVILSKARSDGEAVPRFGTHGTHDRDEAFGLSKEFEAIHVRGTALELLEPDASARGLTANQLARQIVETVAHEHLVDAVLDDKGAAQ